MVGFSSEWIDIQLEIYNPELIAENGEPDVLSVTFWGIEYFRNTRDEEVLYGTELRTDIFRQITNSEAEFIEQMFAVWWPLLLLILCFCIIGAQLPTWMFLNSLCLMAHTTLLNSLMPPSVFYISYRSRDRHGYSLLNTNMVGLVWKQNLEHQVESASRHQTVINGLGDHLVVTTSVGYDRDPIASDLSD